MQEKLTVEPRLITTGEPTFVYDVATLINAIYQTTIELTREGNVPKRITKKLRPLLKGQERIDWDEYDIYIDMMIHNLLDAKILTQKQPPIENAKFRLAPGPKFEQWANKNVVQQTSLLLEGWQASYNWVDVPVVTIEREYSNNPYTFNSYTFDQHLRSLLLTQLDTYPAGSWYTVSALVQEIWEAHPELDKQQKWKKSLFNRYAEPTSKASKRDLFAEWAVEAAPTFINMLYSSLLELGIVDVGNDPLEGGIVLRLSSCAFRLTELGKQAIAQVVEPKQAKKNTATKNTEQGQPDQRQLIVQPNYEILLLHLDLPTLYRILPFTQVKQIQMVSTLVLNQSSFLRALQHGLSVEKVLTTLQELSLKELPQNVVYSLQDWARQHKQATISQVVMLELSDEEAAARIIQHPTLVKMNARQLTPTVLAIPFNESGNTNYQSIQQLLDKENISLNFLIPSNSRRNRDSDYY